MNEEFSNGNAIETEIQVRLMNLVIGEASDFERDQLQLMMEQRAELAAYYQYLARLHGMLREVGAGEPSMEVDASASEDAWQLSPDRRERVLAVLNGKDLDSPAKVVLASSANTKQESVWLRWWTAGVVVSAASVLLGLMLLPSVQSARSAARKFNRRFDGETDGSFHLSQATPAASNATVLDSGIVAGTPKAYYLDDDVQYFAPAPSKQYVQPGGSTSTPAVDVTENFGGRPSAFSALREQSGRGGSASGGGFGTVDVGGMGPNEPRIGNWQESSLGYSDESPKTETVEWESGLWQRAPADIAAAVRVPSFGEPSAVQPFFTDIFVPQLYGGKSLSDIANSSSSNGLNSRFGSFAQDSSTLMMTVTPKMIIPEVEEVPSFDSEQSARSVTLNGAYVPGLRSRTPNFTQDGELNSQIETVFLGDIQVAPTDSQGQVIIKGKESDVKRVNELFQQKAELMESQSFQKGDLLQDAYTAVEMPATPLAFRLNSQGAREIQMDDSRDQIAIDVPLEKALQDGVDYVTKELGNDLLWDNKRVERKRRMSTPAPSPEIVSSIRDRVVLEAELAEHKKAAMVDEQSVAAEAFTTFSLHVSDVSFKLAQTALSQGQWPEAAKIRIEEFVNALDYHDPLPSGNQKVACRVEQAIHPFLMQRNLLRVSMRTAATGRSLSTPLRLTLLLDNSGSMERLDRRRAVLRAFQTLTAQLTSADQVTLISFASTPRLLADKVPGNQGETLLQIVENLPSEGGTNMEAALLLAREKAAEQQLAGAQNRIVLLTDGAVNLGDANPVSLAKLVTQLRDAGIAFDAAGISAQDLNDEVLEALTRQGDGRYYLLDSAETASGSFAAQIAGALRPSAQNVKVQVEFNPQRVGRYKLLGFEKHRLNKEEFRNDQVDAAEMAAAETGVAVYQFEIKPNGRGDVGSVSVRFRDLSTDQMVERRWPIPYEPNAPRLEQSAASMQLAASAALFAAKLSGGPLADSVDLAQLHKLLSNLSDQCANQPRVQQLRAMIDQATTIGK